MNHTNSEPLLEVRNLKKYFGKKGRILHAVDDISVSIGRGKTLGVVGESGCGKSTLGRTVLRLLEPTGGQILFEGKDITHVGKPEMRRYRQSMQIVFQDPYSSLNPRKSVAEIIATPLKVNHICKSRADLQKRVRELMDTVGLAERLDVSIQAQILNLLMDLQDEMGLTYLFITHDLSVVKHISSDIMVMYMGSCVEYAPANELFENPMHPYTKALLSAIPVPDISMRNRKIQPIRGEVASPINPQPGCRFAPRCDFACAQCTGREVPLQWRGGHAAACCRLNK